MPPLAPSWDLRPTVIFPLIFPTGRLAKPCLSQTHVVFPTFRLPVGHLPIHPLQQKHRVPLPLALPAGRPAAPSQIHRHMVLFLVDQLRTAIHWVAESYQSRPSQCRQDRRLSI
ncbi:hypothetical protein B0T17DRAFT_532197 [Bombardia bombarda]|uniref:Uncharacterized protein n=1 Tax=Bombardia bombarda TaxID=252184 RepID=A0AA39X0U1_9PEZI|nr:hypothetical protein B0T17DRAFT_532197 [Bombardia bombarda]